MSDFYGRLSVSVAATKQRETLEQFVYRMFRGGREVIYHDNGSASVIDKDGAAVFVQPFGETFIVTPAK